MNDNFDGGIAVPQRTIPYLFEESVGTYPANVYLWENNGEGFRGTTYSEVRDSVYLVAGGLLALGIQKGDRIALIAEGRNDWIVAELGIMYAGAVNVPLSVKLNEHSEIRFRLEHSGCRMAIVSGRQLRKIRDVESDLPELEKIIVLDAPAERRDDELTMEEIRELGAHYLRQCRPEFDRAWQNVQENDPATICYTSGTTADPKGVVLTHRNYTANVEQASALLPVPEHYCSLIILPWDHCF